MNIKDAILHFFYNQGITIVTIQPEFKTKSNNSKTDGNSRTSLAQCLIGCQSLECAPKTCCSTNDLHTLIVTDANNGELNAKQFKKQSKTERKSSSLFSLNVTSLTKLRRLTGSQPDIMKKSVSESHVTHIASDNSSENTSTNASTTQSTANHLDVIHNSIDELKESEFHKQCDERSDMRLPSVECLASYTQQNESNGDYEESTLLDKPNHFNETTKQTTETTLTPDLP